jgi:hypothetical protein
LGPKIAGIIRFLFVTTYFSKNVGISVIYSLFTMPLKKLFRSTFCEISHILTLNIHIQHLESTPHSKSHPYFSSAIHIEFVQTTPVWECQPHFWAAILIILYWKAGHSHSELGLPYQSWGILFRKIGQPTSQLGQPYQRRGILSKCICFSESALWSEIEKCALLFWGLFPKKRSIFQAETSHFLVFLILIWFKSDLSRKNILFIMFSKITV